MANKFDFDVAQKLVEAINKNVDVMINEKQKVNSAFKNLGSTFKDSGYNDFETEFSSADKNMDQIIEDLRSIATQISRYAEGMRDSV